MLYESRIRNRSHPLKIELLLTYKTGVVPWCRQSLWCVWCPTAGCRAGRVRPSGSDRLAQDLVRLSVARSPSDVSGGRPHHCSFTACFHVPFNEETAGSAASYKTQAN